MHRRISTFFLVLFFSFYIHINFAYCQDNGIHIVGTNNITVNNNQLSAHYGNGMYTASEVRLYFSDLDQRNHAYIHLETHHYPKDSVSTTDIYAADVQPIVWDYQDAELRTSGQLFYLGDTLCVVAEGDGKIDPNQYFLLMLVDMKLVKTLSLPESSYTKLATFQGNENQLIIINQKGSNKALYYRYSNGKLETPVEIFSDGTGINHKVVFHPNKPTFLYLHSSAYNPYSSNCERYIQNIGLDGTLVWNIEYTSDTFQLLGPDIAYITPETIGVIYANSYYLPEMHPNSPDYYIYLGNYNASLKIDLISDSSGLLMDKVDITKVVKNRLREAPIHTIKRIYLNSSPNLKHISISFTSYVNPFFSTHTVLLDKHLKTIAARSFNSEESLSKYSNYQTFYQHLNDNGSFVNAGIAINLNSKSSTWLIIKSDTSGCLTPDCLTTGCTDFNAYNYDSHAIIDNGQCLYSSCDSLSYEVVLTSNSTFEYIDSVKSRQGAFETMTITGSNDGVVYLKKTLADMCQWNSLETMRFTFLHQKLCLPKHNDCYLVKITSPYGLPLKYRLYLIAQLNYQDYSTLHVKKDVSLSLNGLSNQSCLLVNADQLLIFPNPSNGNFTIQTTPYSDEQTSVNLYDISGQLIYSQDISNQWQANISIQGFTNGIYFGRLRSNKAAKDGSTFKILKY